MGCDDGNALFDFSAVKGALSNLQFQSDPGGFVIFEEELPGGRTQRNKENQSGKVTFSVEPYWDCRNWDVSFFSMFFIIILGPYFSTWERKITFYF